MRSKAASWRAPQVATTKVNIPVRDKGKRKIVDNMEEQQSCKFQADPLVQKEALEIEAKMQQCDKRNMQRQRENRRKEEIEKELHDLKEKLRKEQGMHRHGKV